MKYGRWQSSIVGGRWKPLVRSGTAPLLDAGCGAGRAARQAAELIPEGEACDIDISPCDGASGDAKDSESWRTTDSPGLWPLGPSLGRMPGCLKPSLREGARAMPHPRRVLAAVREGRVWGRGAGGVGAPTFSEGGQKGLLIYVKRSTEDRS